MRGEESLNKATAQRRTVFDVEAVGPTGSNMREESFQGGATRWASNGHRKWRENSVYSRSTDDVVWASRQPCELRKLCPHDHVALTEESDGGGEHRPHQDRTSGIKEQALGLRPLGL